MNKLQFLAELRANIHMLEDEEQVDIIDEYSQHVDMKIAAGMSEAEAIAEFGPIDELIEEILAAYHVKAPEKKMDALDTSAHVGLLEGGKQAAGAVAGATKKGFSRMKDVASNATTKAKDKAAEARAKKAEGTGSGERPQSGAKTALAGLAHGGNGLWTLCVKAIKACIRWCWNALVACAAISALLGAICSLFGFGFCIVLMFQGYPLIGVTIALLGGTVTLTFSTLLLTRFIVLKKTDPSSAISTPSSPTSTPSSTIPLPYVQANEVI